MHSLLREWGVTVFPFGMEQLHQWFGILQHERSVFAPYFLFSSGMSAAKIATLWLSCPLPSPGHFCCHQFLFLGDAAGPRKALVTKPPCQSSLQCSPW